MSMVFSDADALAALLEVLGVALLIVDPFNHAHNLDDGNNNVMVARVAQEMTTSRAMTARRPCWCSTISGRDRPAIPMI